MDPFLFFFALAIFIAALHLYRERQELSRIRAYEILLVWLLVFAIGFNDILAGLAHIFMGPEIAAQIGWPPGSPFQYEVGCANLALGVVGVLCYRFRDHFWLGTILACLVFGWGAGIGHVRDILVNANFAPYNAGPILLYDFGVPLLLVALWLLQGREIARMGMQGPAN